MTVFDLAEEIPYELSNAYSSTSTAAANVPASMRWDCRIADLPFLFADNQQYPQRRETATFRRERIDTERNPGEQSLDSGYWLRSQASWHYGAGLSAAEPLEVSDTEAQFRYKTGGGVDPWTPGTLRLLKASASALASAESSQLLLGVNTGVLHGAATTVTYVPVSGSASAVTWGGSASAITSMTSDGANYYVANAVGIYKGVLPAEAGSKIWDTGSTTLCRWVKSRLMAAVGVSLYELTTGGPTLPTALFTHTNSSWTWTDFAEGPTAIYASGYSGDQSYIYKIAVTATSSTITLSVPVVVAEMPRGETVLSLYSYVGAYLAIGTSKGVRVANIESEGSLTLGPLVVETTDGSYDAVADGSFLYVTVGSKGEAGNRVQMPGLYRIDLGTNLNGSALQFASAADLVAPSGSSGQCRQVTTAGGYVYFTVTGLGVYKQSDSFVDAGWVETGRIRLGTLEDKAWRELRVLQDSSSLGTVTGYATVFDTDAPSAWSQIVQSGSSEFDISGSLNTAAETPYNAIYVAFKLVPGSGQSPVMIGYQAKAVPAPNRSTLLQVSVMCFDKETDRQGARYGQEGGAWARYQLVKQLENTASTVMWRDYTTGESAEAYIEQVALNRTTPPKHGITGPGGILTLTLRLV